MSELRRHIMMQQSGGGVLPREYQQVEYLQGDGIGAYILLPSLYTSTKPSRDIFVGKVLYPNSFGDNNKRYAIGGFGLYESFTRSIGVFYRNRFGIFTANINMNPQIRNLINKEIEFYLDYTDISNGVVINGTTYSLPTTYGTMYSLSPTHIALFAGYKREYNAVEGFSNNMIYYINRYVGEQSQELIPCYRKSDNEAGMYDVVNDVFYTNAGTGSFIVGADVN